MAGPLLFEQWLGVVNQAFSHPFENEQDKIIWKWHAKGFTSKLVYDKLTTEDDGYHFRHIWKAKIPYKIKIFCWLLEQRAVLTKDNMIKRRWDGDPTCHFCPCPETVDHLFFQCPTAKEVWGIIGTCLGADNTPRDMNQYKNWLNFWLPNGASVHMLGFAAICWAIWKSRNRACFDNKILRNPAEIVIHACALMAFWAGLYTPELQDQLAVGMKFILSCAHRVLARQTHPAPLQLPQPMEGETRRPVQLRQLLPNEEDASDQEEDV